MSEAADRELREAIIPVLRESKQPLRALDIARKIGRPRGKTDVNRVLHNVLLVNGEAERCNPGLNPPLWRLVQSPTSRTSGGASPSPHPAFPSPSSVGDGLTPSPLSATKSNRSHSGGSDRESRPEVYSKTVEGDGSIKFTPVSSPSTYSSIQISPEEVSLVSPQQAGHRSGVCETGAVGSSPALQIISNTAVGAVASSLNSSQKPKKTKRKLAASFGQGASSEGSSHDYCEQPSRNLIGQETESPDNSYVGQENERADQERFTQERSRGLVEEFSSLNM